MDELKMQKADIFLPGCNSGIFAILKKLILLGGFLTFDSFVEKPISRNKATAALQQLPAGLDPLQNPSESFPDQKNTKCKK